MMSSIVTRVLAGGRTVLKFPRLKRSRRSSRGVIVSGTLKQVQGPKTAEGGKILNLQCNKAEGTSKSVQMRLERRRKESWGDVIRPEGANQRKPTRVEKARWVGESLVQTQGQGSPHMGKKRGCNNRGKKH